MALEALDNLARFLTTKKKKFIAKVENIEIPEEKVRNQ